MSWSRRPRPRPPDEPLGGCGTGSSAELPRTQSLHVEFGWLAGAHQGLDAPAVASRHEALVQGDGEGLSPLRWLEVMR